MVPIRHFLPLLSLAMTLMDAPAQIAGVPFVFRCIEDMRRADVSGVAAGQLAHVLGYYAENDGGGGEFYWLSGSEASLPASNLGTVFMPLQATAKTAGRWVRVMNSHRINVLWFGVRPLAFDDPEIEAASAKVAPGNLTRIRNALESLPSIPGGASASGPAHMAELYFPALPFVRSGTGSGAWVTNRQATCYFISDTLRVTKSCTISGDGMEASAIVFSRGVAPDIKREMFVVDFEKWGIEGLHVSQGETFECHLQSIAIRGGMDNPGSSGVRMDGAQMSSIENVAISDVGLRGAVASAYWLHNLSIGRVKRGPGLEITEQGSDFGFCCASHIFVGFVNVEEAAGGFVAGPHKDNTAAGIGDGDYYPAVQLNRCEHFTCGDLRIERAPIALKVGLCGNVHINHLSASSPQGTRGLSAIKLKNPRDGGYVGSVNIQGIDAMGYDFALWDNAASPDASATPGNQRYARLSSFRRDSNNLHSGVLRLQGQGAETPLQAYVHPNSSSEGGWICKFFNLPLNARTGSEMPAFSVRNDGLIHSWGGTVPVATRALRIIQSDVLHCSLPALEPQASREQRLTIKDGRMRQGDVVTLGFVRGPDQPPLPSGVVADASVMDATTVAVRFTNLRSSRIAGGDGLAFRLVIHCEAVE